MNVITIATQFARRARWLLLIKPRKQIFRALKSPFHAPELKSKSAKHSALDQPAAPKKKQKSLPTSSRYLEMIETDKPSLIGVSKHVSPDLLDGNSIIKICEKTKETASTLLHDPYLLNLQSKFIDKYKHQHLINRQMLRGLIGQLERQRKATTNTTFLTAGGFFEYVEDMGMPISLIIDVGFARGTPELASIYPTAKYLAIDPSPANREWMDKFAAMRPRTVSLPLALSNNKGKGFLKVPNSSTNSTLVDSSGDDTVEVEVTTLDDVLSEHAATGWCLLKVDTEGNDVKVLEGGGKTLASVGIIMAELRFDEPNHENSFEAAHKLLAGTRILPLRDLQSQFFCSREVLPG